MAPRLENLMPIQDAKRSARRRQRAGGRAPGRLETVEQRHERVLRLVWPLFLKKGYDNVSIDEIIGVIGGSKATIYAWFGGKEGLFAEVLKRAIRTDRLALFEGDRGRVGFEIARHFANQSAHHNEERLHAFQFLLRAATSPTTSPMLNEAVQQRFMGPIREWLGGDDADVRSRLISAFFIGLLVERLIRDEPLPEKEREPFIEKLATILQDLVDGQNPTGGEES